MTSSSRDLAITYAAILSGKPIGDIHVQVLMRRFELTNTSAHVSYTKNTSRRLLEFIAADPDCRQLWQDTVHAMQNTQPATWSDAQVNRFVTQLRSLIDLGVLLEDMPLLAYRFESMIDEQVPRDIERRRSARSWYLQLTCAGSAQVETDDGIVMREAGDLILAPPGARLHMSRAPQTQQWRYVCVFFQPRAQWLPWLQWGQGKGGLWFNHVPETERIRLEHLFDDLIETTDAAALPWQQIRFTTMELLLLRCRPALHMDVTRLDSRIILAQTYMTQHLHEAFGIEDVASAVNLSATRLSVLFQQQLGTSIVGWRDQQRIQKAVQLLRETDMPVKDIAKTVGYADPYYFSRVFRHYLQVPPTIYRKTR